MSFARGAVVHLVIVGLIAAIGASIVTGVEVWPFCNYPMFSRIPRPRVGPSPPSPRLVVIHEDGSEHSYPSERPVLYRELDDYGVNAVLHRLLHRGGREPRKVAAFLDLLLEGLERTAPNGAAPADRPKALRLYLKSERRQPDGTIRSTRRLLLEVTTKEGT